MKKLLAVILALMLCLVCAAEEMEPVAFETYSQSLQEFTEEVWKADDIEQIQTLAPEDGVMISVCLEAQNVACITVEFLCEQVTDSVRAAVENLGWLSEDAIEQVFALADDAQLEVEDCVVYRVHGEKRDALSICRAADVQDMLWQPIHGGKKLHTRLECSGMDCSRMITEEAAVLINWEKCKSCGE